MIIDRLEVIKKKEGDINLFLKKKIHTKKIKEIYFTKIKFNKVKAWKKHTKMTSTIVVTSGKVLFVFIIKKKKITKIIDCKDNIKIIVPPKIWFGFKGLSKPYSTILNVTDMLHNDKEVDNRDINYFGYKW